MGNLTNMVNNKNLSQFFVIGNPIKHSLSPILHNEIFRQLQLDARYNKKLIHHSELEKFLKKIFKKNISGLNVTIPYKKKIVAYLDHINPRAKKIGAINCILNKNNKLWGFNTDWFGFSMLLKKNNIKIKDKIILILGAGGVAYSVLYSLIINDANKIFINNRNQKNTKKLINNFKKNLNNLEISEIKSDKINPNNIDIIINCTPLGMLPLLNKSPIAKKLILPEHIVIDTIYTPNKTHLLSESESKGAKIINGLDMFIYQGIASIDIWYEKNISEQIDYSLIKKTIIENLC